MRHHDSDPHDALNDYLDSLAGVPPAGSRAGDLDPDLRDGVDRFFDLAEQAGATPRANTRTEHQTMSTNLTLPASGATAAPPRASRRQRRSLPRWTEHLHLASTALLIVTVIALAVALFNTSDFGPNGGGEGEPSGNLAAVPLATVEPDAETSSIPYPTADECTIEVSRDEVVAHIEAANMATHQDYERYEQAIEPSAEDAQGIMQTFREWQACSAGGLNVSQLELQTPWFTANFLPVFYNYQAGAIERPISEEKIQEYADILLGDDPLAIAQVTAVAATPPAMPQDEKPSGVPIPANATPIAFEGGRSFPTIFADDIVITGPDTAYAKAYFIDETTGEVNADAPSVTYGFVKVDGQWLIDTYREGVGG